VLLFWIITSAALATFCVETGFITCVTMRRLLDAKLLEGSEFFDMRCVGYFWLVVGAIADFVFNHTRGSLMFREGPRKLLFTHRVQYHIDHSDGWRLEKARRWAALLNAIAPGHIKLP